MWRDVSQSKILCPLVSELLRGCLLKKLIPRRYLILTNQYLCTLLIFHPGFVQTAPFVYNILLFSFSILLYPPCPQNPASLRKFIVNHDRIGHILHCAPTVFFNYFYTECSGILMHVLVHICILPAGLLEDSAYGMCIFVPPIPTIGVQMLHTYG